MEHNNALFHLNPYKSISESEVNNLLGVNSNVSLDAYDGDVTQNNVKICKKPTFSLNSGFNLNFNEPLKEVNLNLTTDTLNFKTCLINTSCNSENTKQCDSSNNIRVKKNLANLNNLKFPFNNFEISNNENQFNNAFTNTPLNFQYNQTSTQKSYALIKNLDNDSSSFPNFENIPVSIQKLYTSIRRLYSDFAFIYAVSAQMCQDIVPMNCFINLKIALMLSLASTNDLNEDGVMPIPIIAIAKETSFINLIMTKFRNVSKRFVSEFQTKTSMIEVQFTKNKMVEAGSLFLARGGVCYFGNWCSTRHFNEDKIFKIIEDGKITVEDLDFNVHCAIWTYWVGIPKKCNENRKIINFLEIFGIPIIMEEDQPINLIQFLLEKETGTLEQYGSDDLSLPEYDIKIFLTEISRRTVHMTEVAGELLQKYFVKRRRDKSRFLSQKALTVLFQFSESFAKLCFRTEILKIDVIAAIFVVENSLNLLFGPGYQPSPRFQITDNFIATIELFIKNFEIWLDNYLNTV